MAARPLEASTDVVLDVVDEAHPAVINARGSVIAIDLRAVDMPLQLRSRGGGNQARLRRRGRRANAAPAARPASETAPGSGTAVKRRSTLLPLLSMTKKP